MKLSVTSNLLLEKISIALKAVSTREAKPELTGILFSINDDSVHLYATDFELALHLSLPADIIQTGDMLVPGKELWEVLRRLPQGLIWLETKNQQLHIRFGKSELKLPLLDADAFPRSGWQNLEENFSTLRASVLQSLIRKVSYAVGKDTARPVLTGIYVQGLDDRMEMASSDNVRLAYGRELITEGTLVGQWVIPAKPFLESVRILPSDAMVNLFSDQRSIHFRTETVDISIRLIDGHFPDFRNIIPKAWATTIYVARDEALNALERASLFCESDQPRVQLDIEQDHFILRASSADKGDAYEEIAATITGDLFHLALNPRFLIEALKNMETEEVAIELSGHSSPLRLRPKGSEGQMAIIVPLLQART